MQNLSSCPTRVPSLSHSTASTPQIPQARDTVEFLQQRDMTISMG